MQPTATSPADRTSGCLGRTTARWLPSGLLGWELCLRQGSPGDFDGCWEEAGIDFDSLDPVLLDFEGSRAAQKAKFGGELFPAFAVADLQGSIFLDFFQMDKDTGSQKGIIALDLGGLR